MNTYRVTATQAITGAWIVEANDAIEALQIVEGDNSSPFEIIDADSPLSSDIEKL
jgi:hypothetical protein